MKIKNIFIFFSFVSIFVFSLDLFAIDLKPNFIWPTPHGTPLDSHEAYQSKAADYLSPIQLGYGELSNTRNEFFDVIQNNAVRSLFFSRFQSYFQFGVYDQ
ncbi:MAG: hypothetical protein QE271_04385 [Bacteriovoracaceae bacterium]|nr:hypothetical protein [Bacteriovoracaceae bacterium]